MSHWPRHFVAYADGLMADPPELRSDDDPDAAWRRERLESLLRLGSVIATVGWLVAFAGLLIAIRWQGELAATQPQPGVRLEALALPLLLSSAGVGLVGLGHLLRIVPVISGMAAPEPGTPGPPRSFGAFLRTMRSHEG
jgi:hypothetical protein